MKAIFVVALVAYFIAIKTLPEYMANRLNIKNMLSGTGSGRTIIWKNFITIYANGGTAAQIFGFGRGACKWLYYDFTGTTYYLPHNMYIKTLIEGGIVGVLCLLIMLVSCFKRAIKAKNTLAIAILSAFVLSAAFLDMDDTRTMWIVLLFVYQNFETVENKRRIQALETNNAESEQERRNNEIIVNSSANI